MNDLTRAREGFKRFANGFTSGQKAVTVAALVAVVVAVAIFMSVSRSPSYAPLFTNLQPTDAANITSKLSSDGVPFQLADNGSTIMVPQNDVASQRLALASAGLPAQSTVGLSLLDKEGITTSDLTQQADYLQALQGELEQTIDSIQGVSSSTVNVAIPASQSFSLTSNNPTGASVMVSMEPGQKLTSDEVQAIVHLVGSSVPNLDSQDVTVADSDGDLLAGPGVAASSGSDDATQSYDDEAASKVDSYLAAVVGPNNADVQVNATLDYDQVSTQTQTILPGANGQPASFCTQTSTSGSNYTGAGSPPGGTAGTVSTGSSGNGNYTQNQSSQTCETNEQTQTDQQAPGTVKSQSVAVLVNSRALPSGVNVSSLQAGVAAAAGIDSARGDTFAFTAMPFSSAAAQEAAKQAAMAKSSASKASLVSEARLGVVVIVILAVLFLLWRSARKARKTPATSIVSGDELAALGLPRAGADATIQMPALGSRTTPNIEAAQVNSFIDSQPDDVASMLRTWINERQGVSS